MKITMDRFFLTLADYWDKITLIKLKTKIISTIHHYVAERNVMFLLSLFCVLTNHDIRTGPLKKIELLVEFSYVKYWGILDETE